MGGGWGWGVGQHSTRPQGDSPRPVTPPTLVLVTLFFRPSPPPLFCRAQRTGAPRPRPRRATWRPRRPRRAPLPVSLLPSTLLPLFVCFVASVWRNGVAVPACRGRERRRWRPTVPPLRVQVRQRAPQRQAPARAQKELRRRWQVAAHHRSRHGGRGARRQEAAAR
jgi:hypothetical protein